MRRREVEGKSREEGTEEERTHRTRAVMEEENNITRESKKRNERS